jgi:hypothetical protein
MLVDHLEALSPQRTLDFANGPALTAACKVERSLDHISGRHNERLRFSFHHDHNLDQERKDRRTGPAQRAPCRAKLAQGECWVPRSRNNGKSGCKNSQKLVFVDLFAPMH